MTQIEIIEQAMDGSPHLTYKAFKNIPPELLITEDTPSGTTVYVANFPRSFKMKLRKYHKPATDSFPSGGYSLWNPKLQVIYSCYLDAAMIHPDNAKNKRKKQVSRKVAAFFE
jgi:hypothetical protein